MLRNSKDEAISAALSQYETRGSPAASTGWNAKQIHLFTKGQLAQFEVKKVRRSALGGHAWLLPKKSSDGKPAPLPAAVVRFAANDNKRKAEVSEVSLEQFSYFKFFLMMMNILVGPLLN